MDLLDRLNRILPAQFEELVYKLRVPSHYLSQGAQVTRAIELLRYLEAEGRTGELERYLPRAPAAAVGIALAQRATPTAPPTSSPSPSSPPSSSASADPPVSVRVYVAHADPDAAGRDELLRQLAPSIQSGSITVWHRGLAPIGSVVEEVRRQRLADAEIIVLLLSADLTLERRQEVDEALARQHQGAVLVPVLFRPMVTSSLPIAELQPLPSDRVFVTSKPNRDAAWVEVSSGLLQVADEIAARKAREPAPPEPAPGPSRPGSGWTSRKPPTSRPEDLNVILFITANPSETTRLALRREVEAVEACLARAPAPFRFRSVHERAVTPGDLIELMLRHNPAIVHFSGHGSKAGQILLENEDGKVAPINMDTLARLFAALAETPVRCVVMNACYSDQQAGVIARHVDCVLGISGTVRDETATAFSVGFYAALAVGRSVETAAELARVQAQLGNYGRFDALQLLTRPGVSARDVRFS